MSFNPLGNFQANSIVQPGVIAIAKAFKASLPDIPNGLITRIFLHWTVAGLCVEFPDYNAESEYCNGKHILKITHNPEDNAPGINHALMASHTWHRNTGALGIAITGMDGATVHDFGPDTITLAGLELLCAGAAALASKYNIDASGKVLHGTIHVDNNGNNVNTTGEFNIITHGEAAVIDAYSSERWDLGSLTPLPTGVELTSEMRTMCGNALRTKIHLYKIVLKG
jgi:hypothetical protein